MKQKYILVSLMNGLGGASLALQLENITPFKTYFSEIDKFSNKVYTHNFPNAISLGDVRFITIDTINNIRNEALNNNAKIILIGGSPCQNLSIHGNKKGLSTTCNLKITTLKQYASLRKLNFNFIGQSFLFWEYIRVKKLLKPDFFLLENVRMAKEWRDVFDNATGVTHFYLDSKIISSQSRKRLYWSNVNPTLPSTLQYNSMVTKDILDKNAKFAEPTGTLLNKWGNSTRLTKVSNINSKCHTLTASMFRNNISRYIKNDNNLVHKLSVNECERLQGIPVNYCKGIVSDSQALKMIGNGFEINSIRAFIKGMLSHNLKIKTKLLF